MKEYSVLVLMHPLNHKGCFEILFSTDGLHYSSLDKNSPEYFRAQGLTTSCRFEVTKTQYFGLLAKSLETKLLMMDMHTRYRDYANYLYHYKRIAVECVKAQMNNIELEVPEVVVTLANSFMVLPENVF